MSEIESEAHLGWRTGSPRALLVDDDVLLRRGWESALRSHGYVVSGTSDSSAALILAESFEPDIIITDLGGHGREGYSFVEDLRARGDAYVVVTVSGVSEDTRVSCLRSGADDIVATPLSTAELLARMEALLRRPRNMTTRVIPPPPPETAMRFGVLAIDLGLREVTVNGRVVPLTRIEFDLLAELCRNPRSVRARTELLHEVWGHEWVGDTHVVDVHMSNLRRKLHHHAPGVQFVQTVRGIGFRLADDLLRPPALAGSHD